jgi:phosphonate transport system permease protein
MTPSQAAIKHLHKIRPRSLFVWWSVRTMLVLMVLSWLFGGFLPVEFLASQSLENAGRLFGEMRPYPLQQNSGSFTHTLSTSLSWAWGLWQDRGQEAVLVTLAISVLAMVLAGFVGAVASIPAARNLMQPHPFLKGGKKPAWWVRFGYGSLVTSTRILLIFLRAIPEYVWAFLLLGMYGPTAWPMVLALALHNAGILGKLDAEILENSDPRPASAWRSSGASRWTVLLGAIVPQVLPRVLLYFFYRWETCVREATVLGMLGMASLGYWITDARARNHYDEMLYFILCGVLLVFVGDWLSNQVRRILREA